MRVYLFIFVGIALGGCDKLDRTYLPPPGSKFAGGSPGAIQTPLEFPKETGPDTTGFGNQGFGGPTTGQDLYQPPFDVQNGFVTNPQLDFQGPAQPGFQQDLNLQSPFRPASQSPNSQSNFNLPMTTTSYAFTQTTTFPPGQGDLETSTGPSIGVPGSDFDAQRITPQTPFGSAQNIPGQLNFQQDNLQNQESPFSPQAPIQSNRPNYGQLPNNYQVQNSDQLFMDQRPLQNRDQQLPYGPQGYLEPGSKPGTTQYVGQTNNYQTTAPPDFLQGSLTSSSGYQPSYQNNGQFDSVQPSSTPNFKKPEPRNQFQRPTGTNQPSELPDFQNLINPSQNQSQHQNQFKRPIESYQPSFLPSQNNESLLQNQNSNSRGFLRPGQPGANYNMNQYSTVSPALPTESQFSTPRTQDRNLANDRNSQRYQAPISSFAQQPFTGPGSTPSSLTSSIAPLNYTPTTPSYPGTKTQQQNIFSVNKPERQQAEADRNAVILNYENILTPEGEFSFSFDTSNGIHADESGTSKDGVKAQGAYSYTGDDGKLYSVIYSADENGFLPRGDHLPTPPPIPEAILRVIEQAQKDKEAGISHDGSYDEEKYGYKNYGGQQKTQRMKGKTNKDTANKPVNRFQNVPVAEEKYRGNINVMDSNRKTSKNPESSQYQEKFENHDDIEEIPERTSEQPKKPVNYPRQPTSNNSGDINTDIKIENNNMAQRPNGHSGKFDLNERPGAGAEVIRERFESDNEELVNTHLKPSTRPTTPSVIKHPSTENSNEFNEDEENEYVNQSYGGRPKPISSQERRPSFDNYGDLNNEYKVSNDVRRPSSRPEKPVFDRRPGTGISENIYEYGPKNLEQGFVNRPKMPDLSTRRPNPEYDNEEPTYNNVYVKPTSVPRKPGYNQRQPGSQSALDKEYDIENETGKPMNNNDIDEYSDEDNDGSGKPKISQRPIGPGKKQQNSRKNLQPGNKITQTRPSTNYNGAVNEYLPGQADDYNNEDTEINYETLSKTVVKNKGFLPIKPSKLPFSERIDYSDEIPVQPDRGFTTKYGQVTSTRKPQQPKVTFSKEDDNIDDTETYNIMVDKITDNKQINVGQNKNVSFNQQKPALYMTQKPTMKKEEPETGYEYAKPQQEFSDGSGPFQKQGPPFNRFQSGSQDKNIRPFMTPNVPRTDLGYLDDNRPTGTGFQTPYGTSGPDQRPTSKTVSKPIQGQVEYNSPNSGADFTNHMDSADKNTPLQFTHKMKFDPQVSYETGTNKQPVFGQRLPSTPGVIRNNQRYPVTDRNRYDQGITQTPSQITYTKEINYNPSTTPIPSQSPPMYGTTQSTIQRRPSNQGYRNQYSTTARPFGTDPTPQPGYITDKNTFVGSQPSDVTRQPGITTNGFVRPGQQQQNTFGAVPSTTYRPNYSIADNSSPSSPANGYEYASTTPKYSPGQQEVRKPFQQGIKNQYPTSQGYSTQQPTLRPDYSTPGSTFRPGYTSNDRNVYSTAKPNYQEGYQQPFQPGASDFGQTNLPQGSAYPDEEGTIFPSTERNQYQGGTKEVTSSQPTSGSVNIYQPSNEGQSYPSSQFGTTTGPVLGPQGTVDSFQGTTTGPNKVIGEDFSGPKQPQYFDPKTGYHY